VRSSDERKAAEHAAGKSPPMERRSRCERRDDQRNDRSIDRKASRSTMRRAGGCTAPHRSDTLSSLHPFHRLLHGGKLNKGQYRLGAHGILPEHDSLKDAVVISRFRDRGIRQEWRHRIEDHDGDPAPKAASALAQADRGLGLDSAMWNQPKASFPRRALRSRPMCISAATRARWRRSRSTASRDELFAAHENDLGDAEAL